MHDETSAVTTFAATVVVPSRAGVQNLPILLGALFRQDRDDFEVIIVLDGDVDRSREAVERFSQSYGDRLSVVEFPENRGRVAALNAGFGRARGRVLIRCDDDFEPAPDYVSAHVQAHASGDGAGGEVGVVGLPHNRFSDTPYARVYGGPRDARFREEAYARPASEHWNYWAGNCSVTRAAFELVGQYDADYRAYGWEDVDYGYRLHAAGIPVRLVPAAETVHHAAAVSTALRMKRAFYSGAAKRLFDEKHPHAFSPTHDADAAPGEAEADAAPPSLWNRLVDAESRLITAESVERIGRTIDIAVRVLPRPVAEKLIASGVEAASVAGRRVEERLDRTF